MQPARPDQFLAVRLQKVGLGEGEQPVGRGLISGREEVRGPPGPHLTCELSGLWKGLAV